MSRAISASILCILICSATALGDEVHLRNGDRLTGRIVRLTDGKLVLRSDLAGEITVNLADIETFSSDTPLEIHLHDGTVLRQPVAVADPNQFAIATDDPIRPQTIELARIQSINPPPLPEPRWTGSVAGAWSSTRGNTVADSISASASASRRTDKDRLTAGADYGRGARRRPDTGEDETVENWWRARAKYDYFFTEKFFGFIDGRYEKDSIARLERRVVIGGGGGYQWIETEARSFSTEIGLATLFEKYETQPDSSSELSLQAGYHFAQRIRDNLRLVHDLTYYPSLSDFSEFYLTTTGELRLSLTRTMFANFRVIYNYDTTPAPGRGRTDTKYLLGVGITF